MPNFWKAIPAEKLSQVYAGLAMYQWNYHHQLLPQTVDDRVEVVINAPSYQEEDIEEINRELSSNADIKEKVS